MTEWTIPYLVAIGVAKLALAVVFVVAAVAKFLHVRRFAASLGGFGVPESVQRPIGLAVPTAEYLVGLLLLAPMLTWWSSRAAALLLALFVIVIGRTILLGRTTTCHCFGSLTPSRVGVSTLLRAAALMIAAAGLAMATRSEFHARAAAWFEEVPAATAIAVLLAAAAAVGPPIAIWLGARRSSRPFQQAGGPIKVPVGVGLGAQAQRLTVGAPLPDVAAHGSDGTVTTLQAMVKEKGPMLLVIVGGNCRGCDEVKKDRARLEKAAGRPVVWVKMAPTLNAGGDEDGVLQVEVAPMIRGFGTVATPSAVRVDTHGRLESPIAIGATAVRGLVGLGRYHDPGRDGVSARGPTQSEDERTLGPLPPT